MRVVLDTNVLVSGLLQPRGPSGTIVRGVLRGKICLFYDARILNEYREVLRRPKFRFRPSEIEAFLDQLQSVGVPVAASAISLQLPDPDDAPFLEVAVSGGAPYLVTGNRRHFPGHIGPLKVVSPRDFLSLLDSEVET